MIVFILLLFSCIALIYSWFYRKLTYWDRIGIRSVPVNFVWGHFGPTVLQQQNVSDNIQRYYDQFRDSYCGLYFLSQPILLVNHPDYIQKILNGDHTHFYNRNVYNDPENDPMSGLLLSVRDEKWRRIRTALNPAFTVAKTNSMFPIMAECGLQFQKFFDQFCDNGKEFCIRDACGRYTADVIASVGFGCETDVLTNPENPFYKIGHDVFSPAGIGQIRLMINFLLPEITKFFKIHIVSKSITKFMSKVVRDTVEYREKNNITRTDFMQFLIQLKNRGKIQDNDEDTENIEESKLTLEEISAQAFFLYLAAYETTAGAMSFLTYEMSKNKEIQKKLHKENDEIIKKYDGKLTFEALGEMKYLEKCVYEIFRKYPLVPFLFRACTKPYQMPDCDAIIEKDTMILIPVISIQNDDEYYRNPKEFNPDRDELNGFHDSTVNPTFLPFGDGHRYCAGRRMGLMIVKVGMARLISRYNFELGADMKEDFVLDPKALVAYPKGGIQVKSTIRKT